MVLCQGEQPVAIRGLMCGHEPRPLAGRQFKPIVSEFRALGLSSPDSAQERPRTARARAHDNLVLRAGGLTFDLAGIGARRQMSGRSGIFP
jgi:hypothetical protein